MDRVPMTPALLRRIELYKSGRWREALEELPGWEDAVLGSLKRTHNAEVDLDGEKIEGVG